MWAPDYPWGLSEDQARESVKGALRLYGRRAEAEASARALAEWDDDDIPAIVDYLRWCGSPGAVEELAAMNREIDVRHVLPAIRVPTLVIHGVEDKAVPLEAARWMTEQIPGARLVEVAGAGHLHFGRGTDEVNAEVRAFVEDVWNSGRWDTVDSDRVLATVLFTDIVDSSVRLAELGDRAWRELLERHHRFVRQELQRFRGVEVDTAGDGFFASFDGPARGIRCAQAIVDGLAGLGVEVRAGLHTGECEVVDGKVAGIAVHTGARVASQAGAGEVLVSSTVKDLVAGSGIAFADRGAARAEGRSR